MRREVWVAGAAAAVVALAGCSTPEPDRTETVSAPASTTASSPSSPSGPTVTAVASPTTTRPVGVGPTTTADGACPFLTNDQALSDLGERLGRITVSTSAGKPVGCTFYPATGALAVSEHLPPASVPVIRIAITHYADDTAAHNAMVVSSQGDPSAYSDPTTGVDEAISFATTFYAADGDQDRAFTFRKGTTVVLVEVAQTRPAFNAKQVGTDAAAKIA